MNTLFTVLGRFVWGWKESVSERVIVVRGVFERTHDDDERGERREGRS
jgi:hypothetical protein